MIPIADAESTRRAAVIACVTIASLALQRLTQKGGEDETVSKLRSPHDHTEKYTIPRIVVVNYVL